MEALQLDLARIIVGEPGRRLQVDEGRGYVRELAEMMNQVLGQMESLMSGVRRVSDNIAHDLRTPLSRLRNHLSQLQGELEGPASTELDSIVAECDAGGETVARTPPADTLARGDARWDDVEFLLPAPHFLPGARQGDISGRRKCCFSPCTSGCPWRRAARIPA